MLTQAQVNTARSSLGITPGKTSGTSVVSRADQLQTAWGNSSTTATSDASNPLDEINKAGATVNADITGENPGQGVGVQTPVQQGIRAASDATGGIVNTVASAIPGAKPVLDTVGKVVGEAEDIAGNIGGTLADISQKIGLMSPEQRADYDKRASDFANSTTGQATTNIADTLNNLGNIANVILGAKGTVDTAEATPAAISKIKNAVTPEPPPPGTPSAAEAKLNARVQSVADEWKQPTVPGKASNPASFSKASDILAQSPDTPKFLAEQKIIPASHIEDGKYATSDTADALRDTAGKMSRDTLRPSLQMADYSVPKTSVADITAATIKDIQGSKGVTPGDVARQVSNAQKEGAILAKKYPDGMSLTDMHDTKIDYASNGKYSPIGDRGVNNTAAMNRAFGRTLGAQVEAKAPAGLPVKEFNQYLSQYYKAADYLDALNNKKAPVSLTQYIAHRGAQVAGAVVGHGVGGGILGGVGGYMIGGALEHALENLTVPMRASFLRNLEVTNPKAFTQVQDYLKAQNTGENGMLRLLPANADTPIPLGPDSVTPNIQVNDAARAPLPYADPKTGQMRPRPYTSESAPR